MTRIILSHRLILEAAARNRLSIGALGLQLDGEYVDEQGGHEVVDLIDAGVLLERDGRIVPALVEQLDLDEVLSRYQVEVP